MTIGSNSAGKRDRSRVSTVGFFGILGAGNIGNDAQLESILGYISREHPQLTIDAMCSGPERVRTVYGIDTIDLHYHLRNDPQTWEGRSNQGAAATRKTPGIVKVLRLGFEMAIGTARIASWVRRHDVVIVPGAGVLETSLLLRPWGTPYQLLILCLSGKVFRTKVALVCVGATTINQRLTRLLVTSAARLAYYRSYRDEISREVMRKQGINTADDQVYADLAFGIPPLEGTPKHAQTVGVGVMAYYGGNDDRELAKTLHESYNQKLKLLTRYLVDSGRHVRLFVGDSNGGDESVVQEILNDIKSYRPDAVGEQVAAERTYSFAELMQAMASTSSVIATRYHNVLCALKLAKPTIAVGYSPKHAVLMSDMGMAEYSQDIKDFDVELLIKQLDELTVRSVELKKTMKERHATKAQALQQQFIQLSKLLFS